jgi:LysM repeat protein
MKWFKSVMLAGLMAVVAYGLYVSLYKPPQQGPDLSNAAPAPLWNQSAAPHKPVEVQLGAKSPDPQPAGGGLSTTPVDTQVALPGDTQHKPAEPPTFEGGAEARISSALPGDDEIPVSQPLGSAPHEPLPAESAAGPLPSETALEFAKVIQRVGTMLEANQFAEAHLMLSPWYAYRQSLPPDARQQLMDLLDGLAGTVVYSREHFLEPPYIVKPGETLEQIAEAHRVDWKLLAKINGILDPKDLRPGETLKVVRGPFRADITLSSYELALFLPDGRYAGQFPIGVGREVPPAVGEYQVSNKLENPTYYGPNDRVVEGGAADNPLGKRLIHVGEEFAIHGTIDPQSIRTTCDEGCLRLLEKDVDDVYDILSIGSKVVIRR